MDQTLGANTESYSDPAPKPSPPASEGEVSRFDRFGELLSHACRTVLMGMLVIGHVVVGLGSGGGFRRGGSAPERSVAAPLEPLNAPWDQP